LPPSATHRTGKIRGVTPDKSRCEHAEKSLDRSRWPNGSQTDPVKRFGRYAATAPAAMLLLEPGKGSKSSRGGDH
jgi:hypothetical protein